MNQLLIQGLHPLDYLHQQFPATVGHIPLAEYFAALTQVQEQAEEESERELLKLIDERDAAEQAISQAYYLIIGSSPEWSNNFGYQHALEDIEGAVNALKATVKDHLQEKAQSSPLPEVQRLQQRVKELEATIQAQDIAMRRRQAQSVNTMTQLQRENEELRAKDELHRQYQQLLGDEINELISFAWSHGWRSSRYGQGKELRQKLGIPEAAKEAGK